MTPDFATTRGKRRAKIIRVLILFAVVGWLWMGVLLSGMSRPWASVLSGTMGVLSMLVGAAIAGVMYHEEYARAQAEARGLREFSESTLARLKLDMENLDKVSREKYREMGMASAVMAKTVAERAASKLIMSYFGSFESDEKMRSAIREVDKLVHDEIVAYGRHLASSKKV